MIQKQSPFCRLPIAAQQLKTAKQLSLIATVCLFSIYGLFVFTHTAAQNSEKRYLQQSLANVLPSHAFDNSLLATRQEHASIISYQACFKGQPRYQIYEISTKKGYSGLIKLLVAVELSSFSIYQIRPLFHQETPGLGDQIDVNKSDWLQQFSLPLSTPKTFIALQQDGGKIDAITGATITSRAVSNLIKQQFFESPLTNNLKYSPMNRCQQESTDEN